MASNSSSKETRRQSVAGRLQALRGLLEREEATTQDELRSELEKLDFEVNQSTISRDLKRIGAIKLVDPSGRTVYRLAEGFSDELLPQKPPGGLADLVLNIRSNGSLIVVSTTPGSASLIARYLDQFRGDGLLGTIAGDDTIFAAPENVRQIEAVLKRIRVALSQT